MLSLLEPGSKRLNLCGVSRIRVRIFHQRRRRFYAARRSEARASENILPFSSPAAASTRRILVLCESRERWRENEKCENEKQKWLDGLLAHGYLLLRF